MNIELLIYSYMFVCVSMIIFNVWYIFSSKKKESKQVVRTNYAKKEIEKELKNLEKGISVDEEHKALLKKKLKRPSNLTILNSVIIYFTPIYDEFVLIYLNEISDVFLELCDDYKKKGSTESAYFAYLISKYRICGKSNDTRVVNLMFKLLNDDSLYCRENALKALYVFGNADYIVKALHTIDDNKSFHHSKLITDGLLKFEGNYAELIDKLLNEFGSFSVTMEVTIVNYIRYQTNSGYEEVMLKILCDESQDDEVRLSALKYFKKVKYDKAYNEIVKFMDEKSAKRTEYTVVAAFTLSNYPSLKTVEVLKKALHSDHWYVRYNASYSLEKIGVSKEELEDIFNGNDRYAKEIMSYRFEQRKIDEQLNER